MRFSLAIGLSLSMTALFGLIAVVVPVSAKVTATEVRSLVRIELPGSTGKNIPTGSGVIIDPDGRLLTSYSAVSKLVQAKGTKVIVCIAKDQVTPPTCNLEAVLVKTNAASNLALLQINRIFSQNEWRTVEEEQLRNGFSFTPIAFEKNTTTEMLDLGDTLFAVDYPLNASSSILVKKGSAIGYERKMIKNKSTPWLIKTDLLSNQKSQGGAILNEKNQLIGVPTMSAGTTNGYAFFTSLPVINAFLKEALGANYTNNKIPFVFDGNFAGVLGGLVPTNICPDSSRYESSTKTCTCNNGFFAVGKACILGVTYCQVMYPKNSGYDVYLQACTCQINGETRICTENLRKVIALSVKPATPKPATSTKISVPTSTKAVAPSIKATSTKPIIVKATTTPAVKPATSTLSVIEIACKKKIGWSYLKKNNTCVPVGRLSKQTDLALCEVVAMPANKRYFPKGNSMIKRMTYRNKLCFLDEAAAKNAKYKKSLAR